MISLDSIQYLMFYIWSFLPTALVEIYCREQVFVSTKLALVTATFPEPSDPSGHCSFSNLFLCYSFILTQSVQQQQHRTCNFNCTRTQSRLTPPSEIFPVHVGQKGKNKWHDEIKRLTNWCLKPDGTIEKSDYLNSNFCFFNIKFLNLVLFPKISTFFLNPIKSLKFKFTFLVFCFLIVHDPTVLSVCSVLVIGQPCSCGYFILGIFFWVFRQVFICFNQLHIPTSTLKNAKLISFFTKGPSKHRY